MAVRTKDLDKAIAEVIGTFDGVEEISAEQREGIARSCRPARGGTPLYKLYRYVPPQRVWFLSRFGLKTGICSAGAYKRICLFSAK